MRGAYVLKDDLGDLARRFIPTCVGHTCICLSSLSNKLGSSPRAWGIRFQRVDDCAPVRRFIPTCVGHTQKHNRGSVIRPGSSPRAWGIRQECDNCLTFHIGSSPRAWGIPAYRRNRRGCFRFIPTCVGHTIEFNRLVKGYTRFIPTCVGHTKYLD